MVSEILDHRYEVQQVLGKKSGRRSLLARDQVTGELVVVKLLSFNSDFEWDDLKLFEREAETLKSLSHPAVPRYLDSFEVNSPNIKGFALVQSYIPAQTLEQYLQTGRTFTEADIKQVAIAILEILTYLHGLHPPVIHRDLKPSNILLGERSGNSIGQVYLVDFGSVQTVMAAEGGTRTVVGTYGYMPPEQFGARTVPASDLYSLGATLIYLSTGTHPADLPQKDFRIQFEQVTNLSRHFQKWLQLMTEPNLERRPSSATAALKALNEPELNSPLAINVVKPVGSKIQLTKNSDYLEILIPPLGFHPFMIFLGVGAIVFNSMMVSTIIKTFSDPFPHNFSFLILAVPACTSSYLAVSIILRSLFSKIRLSMDQQQISLRCELLGFKFYHPRPALRESITQLVYIPEHFAKDSDGDRVKQSAKLQVWAGLQKYQLAVWSSIFDLAFDFGIIKSDAELEWLAYELSDWLGIEITQ